MHEPPVLPMVALRNAAGAGGSPYLQAEKSLKRRFMAELAFALSASSRIELGILRLSHNSERASPHQCCAEYESRLPDQNAACRPRRSEVVTLLDWIANLANHPLADCRPWVIRPATRIDLYASRAKHRGQANVECANDSPLRKRCWLGRPGRQLRPIIKSPLNSPAQSPWLKRDQA